MTWTLRKCDAALPVALVSLIWIIGTPLLATFSNVSPSTTNSPYWMLSSSWPRLNGSELVSPMYRSL